ncbi:MAG TPA: fatty acid desaturase [Verrucomicrobiae bacterium]|nr:fatty acid desaturase [Verrucomicrobiae bacterium]
MTNNSALTPSGQTISVPRWKEIVAKYQRPKLPRALWQVINTLVPYVALWYLMYLSLGISHWLTAGCALLAGGLLIRAFIIFHDCGHGSFFKSRKANDLLGFLTGVLCFTPYRHWRWEHALHHATSGDLDRRGTGDVWTLTVREYLQASRWRRFAYRLARNPLVLFVLAPLFLFLIKQRFAAAKAPARERRSVYFTNLALLAMAASLSYLFGFETYLLLQLGILMAASIAGVWLFYVQHQFEGVYWERRESWDFCSAALQGSSFYKLPKVLQWFSGNIGFHHIHHLSPRIPNYNLERCHRAEPLFQTVKPVTFFASFKALTFRLWDEQRRKLVGFGGLKREASRLGSQ